MVIYYQALRTVEEDVKNIVLAHSVGIQESLEKHDIEYMKVYIEEILKDIHDPHLVIALHDKRLVTGNIATWPYKKITPKGWVEITLPPSKFRTKPMLILANITRHRDGKILLVGYDLYRLQLFKDTLGITLVENVAISFGIAFFVSLLLIYLLNRHMRNLNQTCERIMQGELTHRVKLSGADDEFEYLARNINAMLDRNGMLLQLVQDSTNALAHDMRTPLSRLRIKLQQALEQPALSEPVQQNLYEAVEHTDGLVTMFDNILQIAKAESRTDTQQFKNFDIGLLLHDIGDFYATFIEDKKQTLELHIPETPVIFCGDQQLLAQAISNLLDNAVKYTPRKGTIAIALTADADFITCTITDNGPGIPELFWEKVKERFFRLDQSRHEAGTVLGMSLADAVAKLHNGQLNLEDNNPGLRISLILPSHP